MTTWYSATGQQLEDLEGIVEEVPVVDTVDYAYLESFTTPVIVTQVVPDDLPGDAATLAACNLVYPSAFTGTEGLFNLYPVGITQTTDPNQLQISFIIAAAGGGALEPTTFTTEIIRHTIVRN